MTDRPSDELVARMAEFIRICANKGIVGADTIVAELPKPVDPVVLACREIIATQLIEVGLPCRATEVRDGRHDVGREMTLALAAYRAGQASC